MRENKHYLYHNTHGELGTDGYNKWVIQVYNLGRGTLFGQKIHHLLDIA